MKPMCLMANVLHTVPYGSIREKRRDHDYVKATETGETAEEAAKRRRKRGDIEGSRVDGSKRVGERAKPDRNGENEGNAQR